MWGWSGGRWCWSPSRDRWTHRLKLSWRRSSAASPTWYGGIELNLQALHERLATMLATMDTYQWTGRVTQMIGLLVESSGPAAAIGDFCEIRTQAGRSIRTQVIGFRDGRVLSMPLEETDGLHLGDPILARRDDARLEAGPQLLGRVIDGFGKPLDGLG